ncbi:M12 family metallo-peptidase [Portibacter marinus]|uniref:M12 family metallo-peptidase n=1 Tax=Portibacter marinus TaxID=2898660 RepID=UPI001F1577CB|nr:M12 family metallo-peptidase [Portibacter marinus]
MKLLSTIFFCFFFATSIINAQQNIIYQDVLKAKADRGLTENVKLFLNADKSSFNHRESDQAVLKFDQELLRKVIVEKKNYLETTVIGLNGEEINLSLVKSNIFAPGFQITLNDGMTQSVFPLNRDEMVFYRGIVEGEPHSLVALSLRDGLVHGFISSESHDLGLEKNEVGQNVLVDLNSLNHQDLTCDTKDDGQGYSKEMLKAPKSSLRGPGDEVKIYIEVESDVVDWQGGVSQTITYITDLFNESAAIYAGDGVNKVISELQVNTSLTYFTTRGKRQIKPSSSSSYLNLFQSAKASSFNGDLAQLVVYNNVGGVAAGFSGLCNSDPSNSMCMSGFVNDYFFNLQIFAHELGHLFGSRHTHACVWNGNNTAIDGCSGSTEGTCPLPPPATNGTGTIMSYCYNNYGLDFNEGFHPQPAAVMQNKVAQASCLGGGTGSNSCFDGIMNGDETGVDCGGSCVACPTCDDGIMNGDETGVDCGGSCPDVCPEVNCEDPANLAVLNMVKNRGDNSARLDWSDVADANTYDVRIRVAGTTSWSTFNATESFIDLVGYGSDVTYDWEVRSNCNGAVSNYVGCTFTFVVRGADVTCGVGSESASLSLNDEESILVSPNPATDRLQIQLNNAASDIYNLDVINTFGQRIYSDVINAKNSAVQLNVGSFDAGLYFISVRSESSKHLVKVVIK